MRSDISYFQHLYAYSLWQFYRECDIYGTMDFIFGNAAAIFQKCNLVLREPGSRGAYNVMLAHGRTDQGQNTGFSLQNCIITASGYSRDAYESYLGRPWRQYSRAVIMQSSMDGVISPKGWIEWEGSSAFDKMYFAEHENVVADFIGGTLWLPSTGVTYALGLG
ncbi:esterase [Lithospermum erythrorhizon]|uniref:Esterase n=1 Tax=Lithospermum erythrorhizon TaxID=34254 RepID=A0AAV3R0S0_LITER